MKWIQLKKGSDGIYRLEVNEDAKIASKSSTSASFSQLSFDNAEERLVATDTRGRLYQFEFRGIGGVAYKKLGKFAAPTCLAFNGLNQSELLVALPTNDVAICNPDSEDSFISSVRLSSHRFPIFHITFYRQFCLTSSSREAIIWDLTTCTKRHQLRLESASGSLKKAGFSSRGHIAVLYSNDALQVWNYEEFSEESRISLRDFGLRSIKDFVFARDGKALVVCAAKGGIRVLDTDRFDLVSSFDFPENRSIPRRVTIVSHPFDAANILAIHCADGSLKFLDLGKGNFVATKQELCRGIRNFAVSARGRWIACVDVNGGLNFCRINSLFPGERKESNQRKISATRTRSNAHQAHAHLRSVKEDMREELRLCRLIPILREFGEYPAKHRTIIWSTIMELPINREACAGLSEKTSQDASIRDMLKKYPLEDQSKASLLATVTDRLVRWCSLLGQCQFLPALIFPFLIVFQKNRLLALEASITILTNFCQKWFEYHPLPPLNVLGIVENVLLEADPALLTFFCERGITSTDYAWPLLRTTLSEVLTADEWLVLWDHILSYRRPSFLLMCVTAYNICCRETVMSLLQNPGDFRRFYSTQGNLSVKKLLEVARRLDQNTPERIHPDRYLRNNFVVVPKEGPYPHFLMHEYPKLLLEEQSGLVELGALKEEERKLEEYHRKAMKFADEKRMRDEVENFVRDVQRNRMIELQKCYNEQLRTTRFNVENTRDEIQRYASTLGKTSSISMGFSRSTEKTETVNSGTRSASIARDIGFRTNNCNELHNQVQNLESQVQEFLGALRSRSSANVS